MAKDTAFITVEAMLVEMGYLPETIDIPAMEILLLKEGLKAGISVSEEETVMRFYKNNSLRKAITKYIWICNV